MSKTETIGHEIGGEIYDLRGLDISSRNRAWVLALLSMLGLLVALGFAIVVRVLPPTVVEIGPTGEPSIVGRPTKGSRTASDPGNDEFITQEFVKRFLSGYLNYSASDVSEHWSTSLNMMTRNLRRSTQNALTDGNAKGKIDDEQIESVFHLRELDRVPGEVPTYLAYGVKDVYHLVNGTETTDHFVNEYRIRLKTDVRSTDNPYGLWIAEYSERPIDGERRDRILSATNTKLPLE